MHYMSIDLASQTRRTQSDWGRLLYLPLKIAPNMALRIPTLDMLASNSFGL